LERLFAARHFVEVRFDAGEKGVEFRFEGGEEGLLGRLEGGFGDEFEVLLYCEHLLSVFEMGRL
jgi:hypothetical protein